MSKNGMICGSYLQLMTEDYKKIASGTAMQLAKLLGIKQGVIYRCESKSLPLIPGVYVTYGGKGVLFTILDAVTKKPVFKGEKIQAAKWLGISKDHVNKAATNGLEVCEGFIITKEMTHPQVKVYDRQAAYAIIKKIKEGINTT